MDAELQETVEQLVGAGAQVLDCEKRSVVREEEVLLVNGRPLQLQGHDGAAIRQALLNGHVPPHDLLNTILVRAGILRAPVRLETSLQVKSSVVTKEEVTVARGGRVVDERSRQTQEDNVYSSSTSEVWEPVAPKLPASMSATPATLTSTHGKPAAPFPPGQGQGCSRPAAAASASAALNSHDGPREVRTHIPPVPAPCAAGPTCCSPLSSSSSSGFWSPGPARSVSDSSCESGRRATASTSSAESADENDAALHREISALRIQPVGVLDSAASPSSQQKVCRPSANADFSTAAPAAAPFLANASCVGPSCLQNGAGHRERERERADGGAELLQQQGRLAYRENVLISGTLEALVLHALPTADYFPEQAYLFAFLLCGRLFIRPHEFLQQVNHLLDGAPAQDPDRLARVTRNVVTLLREWTDTFPYDFRDDRVMSVVRDLAQRCVTLEPAVRREVSSLLQALLHKLTDLDSYEEFLQRLGSDNNASCVDNLSATDVIDLAGSSLSLAQQLTHVELERLSHIGPEEFVQSFAKDHPVLEALCKDAKKTRNLESYVQWFNRLSYLVATEVCKHPKKKHRVRAMEFWIETARECFNIGNFNSLMAIIAGLNMAPVARLKKTWNKVQSAKFSILEHQMDPSCNFSSYRSTLKAAVWRSAQQPGGGQVQGQGPQPALAESIVVPFFSLLVKDLYFLNEGCSNRLPNGHINFEKFWQVAKQVTEFMAWKQVGCPFEKNANVITFLQASPILSDNALALASFECEAPDSSHEKEHFKSLKAELNAINNS